MDSIRHIFRTLIGFVALCVGGSADAQRPSSSRDSTFAWLEGRWLIDTPMPGRYGEQVCGRAAHGRLTCVLRLEDTTQVLVYQIGILEYQRDTLHLLVRHFGSKVDPWEANPLDFRLKTATSNRLVFIGVGSLDGSTILTRMGDTLLVESAVRQQNGDKPVHPVRLVRAGRQK